MASSLDGLFSGLTLTNSVTVSKEWKYDPFNNPFNHILYFHTRFKSSSGYTVDSEDINAGLFEVPEFSKSRLKEWVASHAWPNAEMLTPFKSVTIDPLRAFNHALRLQAAGEEGIEIIIIDAWILGSYNVIPCNTLRELIGEPANHLFDTEWLVWRSIPSSAIIARTRWATICDRLGKALPSISDWCCFQNGNRSLDDLRHSLQGREIELSTLIRVVLDDFNLFQCNLWTKQIAMMILGWTRGYSRVRSYPHIQALLQSGGGKKAIDEIDYRLYLREFRDRTKFLLAFMADGTENSLDTMDKKTRRYRELSTLTFEDWIIERLHLEKMSLQEAHVQESNADDLIPSLISIGLNAQPTQIQRFC